MTWSDDEKKRVDRLESAVASLTRRVQDVESAEGRRADQQKHEFSTMLTAATSVIEKAVSGKLAALETQVHQTLAFTREQMPMIEAIGDELKASAEERLRRAERDRVKKEEDDKLAAIQAETARRREHRLKVAAVIVPLIVAVLGALGAALASHFH